MRFILTLLISAVCFCAPAVPVTAALPPEVRKELSDLSSELRPIIGMVRKKEIDEAKAIIQKVEDRIKELAIAEDEKDRSFTSLQLALAKSKNLIPVSFEAEVAPIIKGKCLGCHGEQRSSANLRLDTYAYMGRGSQSGALLLPRNPQRSLIMARLTVDGAARMPKGGEKLSDDEIGIIGRWIAGGAAFDGADVTSMIGDSLAEKKPEKPPVKVVMADGTETVSFKDHVAPWMVNVCLGCHSGNNPRGGFNITTFEQLLAGGDTGNTVVPGDPNGSYIVDLVLRQDPIKMPAGNQTQIKRSEAQALEKWIKEGAHFDGTDPKATLRSLVPTEAEIEAAKLAAMSDTEFADRRKEQAAAHWKRVAPREETASATTENLYVYGSVPQSRLDEIGVWGEELVSSLASKYKLPAGQKPWRGRLIVFVAKARFDYEEFNTVLMNRRTPRGVSGHSVVTGNFNESYIAMYDVGDTESVDSLNAKQLLGSLLAQAYLSRSGAALPDWLEQGFGLLESGAGAESLYIKSLPQKAGEALSTVTNPATLFDNGTFAPEEVGPVGYLLTKFLMTRGGVGKLSLFAQEMQTNRNAGRAVQATYGQSAAIVGQAFLQSGGR
ncbi:MAG: c-type cytochrome domain-containing protein [Fuerstiella sp.]